MGTPMVQSRPERVGFSFQGFARKRNTIAAGRFGRFLSGALALALRPGRTLGGWLRAAGLRERMLK
jgi:hypothetical protein